MLEENKMKMYKGKAIYNPRGKAAEYSTWACNFYKGCSNGCTYCYLKKGVSAHALGGDKAELKACFKDKANALDIFKQELILNKEEIQEHGIFFSFTTDPMLEETIQLTMMAVLFCVQNDVPVKILTKMADFKIHSLFKDFGYRSLIAFGFTLTGHDELEPNASTNAERIEAMKQLHEAGFKTFASIEPIIDFNSSFEMILRTKGFCDLYKIGLESGKKYIKSEQEDFMFKIICLSTNHDLRVYFKDSILKNSSYTREILPAEFVSRDYNLFQ